MRKRYLAFLQFMIIDMSQILKRNVNFSILTFQNNVLYSKNISTLANTRSKHTNNILDTIAFSKEEVYKIIKNLDPNKAHGHDMISIPMIKLCCISIWKPLEIIFHNCLSSCRFPFEWRRQMLFLHLKKATIIAQFLFSRSAVKCLNSYFITPCFHFFQKTT